MTMARKLLHKFLGFCFKPTHIPFSYSWNSWNWCVCVCVCVVN